MGGDFRGAEIIQLGDAQMNSRAYCSAFNFKGGDQQKTVNLLSGGERNRVHMARLLKSGGNVLFGRTDQRFGRGNIARTRRCLDGFCGLRRGHFTRPFLP